MKVVILAGGLGTRLSEYTKTVPKPMVKIGKFPILIHIMQHYLSYGFNNFYLATGYKSKVIKKYFKNYIKSGTQFNSKIFGKACKVTILDTGLKTLTGGRLKRVSKFINKNENFMFTYGDGISSVNLKKLLNFHISNKKIITVTAVRPPARFGEIILKNKKVISFKEKPQVTNGWINGGFFVANKIFFSSIKGDQDILEKKPLETMVKKRQLVAFRHDGFWKCMDVKRDREELQKIYKKNKFNF
ncbi:MAG: glucose-1-phosphate cytidylyltransferase [Pelagibacteraceae bacterium TMED216]|nr:MAG: glucose-1-phosphate cytidylyltransferase [Pelagibacteraceae bacterium TMED216]|tara:strand:- start:939 stop:1670 length:732 start_codon:yes stop_codon:yes gene_type:complete